MLGKTEVRSQQLLMPTIYITDLRTSNRKKQYRLDFIFTMKNGLNLRIAMYQPDIPRIPALFCAWFRAWVSKPTLSSHVGFPLSHKKFKRAGMDYLDSVNFVRHTSWTDFQRANHGQSGRLVLLTTQSNLSYLDYDFAPGDTLLVGSEGTGVPDFIHDEVSERLVIPMTSGMRSLNVAIAAAMVAGEAMRQLALHNRAPVNLYDS